MLTRQLAIAEYDSGQIVPDRLTRQAHRQYLDYAERMLTVYRTGSAAYGWICIGTSGRFLPRRKTVHGGGSGVLQAFDDASTYHRDSRRRAAACRKCFVLRRRITVGPQHRPALRSSRNGRQRAACHAARPSLAKIEEELFADVIEFHRLKAFEGYPTGAALLARYNVAQVQAAMFDAVSLAIWATEDFKTILRYAKLARLMHTIAVA